MALVLTDLMMPVMDGRELARRLAAACPNLKMMYMSAYTEEAELWMGELGEATAFLQKPFTPNDLAGARGRRRRHGARRHRGRVPVSQPG